MRIKTLHIILLVLLMQKTFAQNVPNCIEVVGRPSQDSIMLRWAPMSHEKWQEGNKVGYTVERFTMVRDQRIINPPEIRTITPSPLKPLPLDEWEPLVRNDRYAAITAQAIYGSSFEIDMGQTDVFTIVNKAKENEQRYQFALFSADMSVKVAMASGLAFTDKEVSAGEKYLYRISIYTPRDTCRGSVYIGSDDVYSLPVISEVKAERKGEAVLLEWQRDRLNLYTAYIVERSENGKTFAPISDEPIVNFSPEEQESSSLVFTSDSVSSSFTRLWYRVVGLTPFGEYGPPGESVEVTPGEVLEDTPYIHTGTSENNQAVTLQWDFPEKISKEIRGFHIDRAQSPNGNFGRLTPQPLSPSTRNFTDSKPAQINYYKVSAISLKGKEIPSPIYLVQLVDSIPPASPKDLSALVSENGEISLNWKANSEPDIYGYRIYRSNYKGEELFQVTHEPVPEAKFSDKVDLNTLNKKIYYQVMAIDRNQNHSVLSSLLEVKLPDKVKPVRPVFYPVKISEKGIELRWQPSSSDDVTKYELYRKSPEEKQWMRTTTIMANGDSVYHFTDVNLLAHTYHYKVIAIDDSGLESPPSDAVVGNRIEVKLKPAVIINPPVVDRERKEIRFSWKYQQSGVKSFVVFKSIGQGQSVQYRTIPVSQAEFTDKSILAGEQYSYRIMAVFENQIKSELSPVIKVSY